MTLRPAALLLAVLLGCAHAAEPANLLANGIAFVIFIVDGQVVWRYCVPALLAAALGGYVSARLARRVPQPVLRALVVVIGLGMAAWFFWRQ